ncbi:pirin family protein [Segniliparus rugosus]|uniref:Quercetin 2,3-dioxygenase n=1 Tax=Segniliparus rugosus (strain ATCC BAA-974 / DSM 45345 / CCUG 50838 / CIP 108380 / JCM 13579 / CDC 945) TaxID=679197 RepID=E5XKK2_SEGRC|nr:pirin family protein [Segniliparus rugosus]EFV15114.1 hypothetical protein HMPREF9336_00021 [Segniliparus rugosus ATCC BAA-974]
MTLDVRRAGDRLRTRLDWLDSRHSFSFGDHYDPDNTHFGVLLVNNDDTVRPRRGFATHPHQNMEIVTWVLDGALEHRDSAGHTGRIVPGLAQRMTAGRGILHSEKNGGAPGEDHDVRFVQMWVPPDETGLDPGYEQAEMGGSELDGRFAVVASGMAKHRDEAAVRIASSHAALHVARLSAGEAVTLPDAPFAHLFVAKGAVALEASEALGQGDAARLTAAGPLRVVATAEAEILVWEMDATLRGLR